MIKSIRKIGIFTSGGDAPGMNAAIRAAVRTARYYDLQIFGIEQGYQGMVDGDIKTLTKGDVANIIHRGGTVLRTARCEEFKTVKGRKTAYEVLKGHGIDACIAIGGNGTYAGAKIFTETYPDIPFIGLPGTIDNDIFGTELTIGFDTAVNTAVQAIDKIRDTAHSHDRLFFIEVMGRHAGFIALHTGVGIGASSIFVPEGGMSLEKLVNHLQESEKRNKLFNLVVVAEGNELGSAMELANLVKKKYGIESRVSILGHMQRGGAPSALDRVLASRMGYQAVKSLRAGDANIALGIENDQITKTPFKYAIENTKNLSVDLMHMAEILSL